ncbi:hypothetical protein Taro_001687 [Colocasia esculenta]|uniref:Uncharacterized protein n=1 Tax=Colocasia esculenta TaxID=4460 RepID=A0A843TIP3_COLES|nr:hypothetical protein [Colocasia esculenta]
MDTAEMETSPGYFDAQDLSVRDQYRRYRKRLSSSPASLLHRHSSSKFAETRLLYDGNSIQRRPNAALLLEEIKQEVDSYDAEGFEGAAFRTPSSSKRRTSMDTHAIPEQNVGFASIKQEEEVLSDVGEEATFALFASLLDSALQGLLPFTELILQFKNTCRDVSESIRLVIFHWANVLLRITNIVDRDCNSGFTVGCFSAVCKPFCCWCSIERIV